VGITSPITWHGSKAKLASTILRYFPEHRTYCEPFGGSAAVLLAKEPSQIEIYNDADGALVNLFRVVRDSKLCAELARKLEHTPYSRTEFELAREKCDDPVEAARRFIAPASIARRAWSPLAVQHQRHRRRSRFGGEALAQRNRWVTWGAQAISKCPNRSR
jgi:site-specific DNA-adenine methylase